MKRSSCQIFSESQQKWFDGKIVKILQDEHVTVRYGDDLEKDIHIHSQNIRIPTNRNQKQKQRRNNEKALQAMKGSSCQIFSESQQKWFDGEIVKALQDEHVTVRYADDLEKDIHIHSQNIRISTDYSEGMEVEVYSHEYSDWIKGTIKNMNHSSHSVDILLDSNQDPHRIGIVHIKGINESNQIRTKQLDPSPSKSILNTSNPKKRESKNNWFKPVASNINQSQKPKDKKKEYVQSQDELRDIEQVARGAPLLINNLNRSHPKKSDPYSLKRFDNAAKMRGEYIKDPSIRRPSMNFDFVQKSDKSQKDFRKPSRRQRRQLIPQKQTQDNKYEYEWSQSTRASQKPQRERWQPMKIPQSAPSQGYSTGDVDSMDLEQIENWQSSQSRLPSNRLPTIRFDDNVYRSSQAALPNDEFRPDCVQQNITPGPPPQDSFNYPNNDGDGEGGSWKPWIAILIIFCFLFVLGGIGAALIISSLSKKKTVVKGGKGAKAPAPRSSKTLIPSKVSQVVDGEEEESEDEEWEDDELEEESDEDKASASKKKADPGAKGAKEPKKKAPSAKAAKATGRRRALQSDLPSNAFDYLFSYSSLCALVIVAITICLQTAYLYLR